MHWTLRANIGAMALVTTIGTIDAVVSARWDLAVLFLIALLLVLPLATGLSRGRRLVLVREDLARWLVRRSATTGEPLGAVADRAVAQHRDALEATSTSAAPGDG